jgi:hypothetical protein
MLFGSCPPWHGPDWFPHLGLAESLSACYVTLAPPKSEGGVEAFNKVFSPAKALARGGLPVVWLDAHTWLGKWKDHHVTSLGKQLVSVMVNGAGHRQAFILRLVEPNVGTYGKDAVATASLLEHVITLLRAAGCSSAQMVVSCDLYPMPGTTPDSVSLWVPPSAQLLGLDIYDAKQLDLATSHGKCTAAVAKLAFATKRPLVILESGLSFVGLTDLALAKAFIDRLFGLADSFGVMALMFNSQDWPKFDEAKKQKGWLDADLTHAPELLEYLSEAVAAANVISGPCQHGDIEQTGKALANLLFPVPV